MALSRAWLARQGHDPEDLCAVRIDSDDLAPQLRASDVVVVDRGQRRPRDGGVFAVAGATITRSADCPSDTCRTRATSSCTDVVTGLRLIASHVGSPTKRRASSVGTTWTSCPAFTSSLTTPTVL